MGSTLENVMESSLLLIENLKNDHEDETRKKYIYEHIQLQCENITPIEGFKNGLEWFNVTYPLALEKELKGKLVVLDFFTYCCINCLHILPALASIEKKFSVEDGIVVIGVHSAKFDNEKDSANILSAIQRYGIIHPVVNDSQGVMWNSLGIPCWPTMLVLGPSGNPLFMAVGESNMDELHVVIKFGVAYFKEHGQISPHSLPINARARIPPTGPLLFPGKVTSHGLKDSNDKHRLAIADSGHNRILVCWEKGEVQYVIGGTEAGFSDGDFFTAKFNDPQGVAFLDDNVLFVADTKNHTIRKIDLQKQFVSTVVPCFEEEKKDRGEKGEEGSQQILKSPWDVCVLPDSKVVLIASAGCHQLWGLFLTDSNWWRGQHFKAGTCAPIAGTGREENRNNAYPHAAAFAQPSGICSANSLQALFIADSESSSIRRVDLADGRVTGVVGGSRSPSDLFCFGDKDGQQWEVRLQHPLGVAWCSKDSMLYFVDSYNHKLKVVDTNAKNCKTLLGSGKPGDSLDIGNEKFNEPGGLCVSPCGTFLYIADTNNNCIKVVNLDNYHISKLDIHFKAENPAVKKADVESDGIIGLGGGNVQWMVQLQLGGGLTFTSDAPQSWEVILPQSVGWSAVPQKGSVSSIKKPIQVSINVPAAVAGTQEQIQMTMTLYTCDGKGQCSRHRLLFLLHLLYSENGAATTTCPTHHILKPNM